MSGRPGAQPGGPTADGEDVPSRSPTPSSPQGAVPPPVVVRRLRPGDEDVVAHLADRNDHFGTYEERDPLPRLDDADARAFLRDDRTATFVAFAGDEPVGFVYACELYRRHTVLRHLCIYEIGVSDRHRGQGVGQALLDAVADHARAEGIDRGFVITTTSNTAAMALYEAAGGQRAGDDDAVFAFRWEVASTDGW